MDLGMLLWPYLQNTYKFHWILSNSLINLVVFIVPYSKHSYKKRDDVLREFTVIYLLRHLIKIGETFLNMAFSKEDILFEDEFDAVMTHLYLFVKARQRNIIRNGIYFRKNYICKKTLINISHFCSKAC